MESKKQERDFQFSLWLFASILLHILIILIALTFYFKDSLEQVFIKKNKNLVEQIITPEQLKQIQLQQLKQQQQKEKEKKIAPVLWKDLKKPKEDLIYTLIPGRQAITEQKQQSQEEEQKTQEKISKTTEEQASIPIKEQIKPQEEKIKSKEESIHEENHELTKEKNQHKEDSKSENEQYKKEEEQKVAQSDNKNEDNIKIKPIDTKVTTTIKNIKNLQNKKSSTNIQEKIVTPKEILQKEEQAEQKTLEQRHAELINNLLKEKLKSDDINNNISNDNEKILKPSADSNTNTQKSTSNPTIVKQKVSLHDLKLGFAKYMQEGNNDILLQYGNTKQSPDTQSLRLITYQQQVAHTMRDAISSHDQYHFVEHIKGSRPSFIITIDRSGKLLDLNFITSSGNELFDKIIQESLRSIKLYPAIPSYITSDIYAQRWIYMH